MTAEVGRCNGVLEDCRVESEEVGVNAIPKPVLNEDKVDINCGGSESCLDYDEHFPGSEQCDAELSNASIDVGDHAPGLPVEDHELGSRDEGHRLECLLSENKEVDGESVDNGDAADSQLKVLVDDHPGIELHDLVNKSKVKLEVTCLVNGDDGVEDYFVGNEVELPSLVHGDDKVEEDIVGNRLELPCLVNGEERVERDPVGDKLESPCLVNGKERVEIDLMGDKLESPCLVNGEERVERDPVGDKLESPCLVNGKERVEIDLMGDKLESPCLVNGEERVERDPVGDKLESPCLVNGKERVEIDLMGDKLESPCLVNGEERVERDPLGYKLESPCFVNGEENVERDIVGDELELPCLLNGEDGAETNIVGNNDLEQRSQLVAEAQEIDSPELVIGNDEKSEEYSLNGQNQAYEAEFQSLIDDNCEFVSQSISTEEHKLELSPSVDVSFKLEETESVVNGDNNQKENFESESHIENEDDVCGPVIDEGKQSEPLFLLESVEQKFTECLPNGDTGLEAQFDLNGDKELESKFSDMLDRNSGGFNGTVHADMQEDVAASADAWVSTGVPVGSNGLFTTVSGNEQKPEVEVPKKMFYCMVKIPRHVDNKIKVQIRQAQMQLDQKTENRDFIKAAIRMKRVSKEQMLEKLKAARQEDKAFRDAITCKRQEMEPVQSTLNRIRNATSVEEFDDKIYQMQYRIEHESMPLREEKQLLRDMKQLKLSRDQLCAIAGPHDELKEAFNDIDKIQESSKLLGQELDSLRKQHFQAEKNVQAKVKDFNASSFDYRQLQDQCNAANDVRQEAYEALRALKKQEYEQNYEFYQCKDDITTARQYASAGDREALDKLSSNQVERIMEIWNKNAEFRKEYVKDNEMSILKRLETLDGRSLGPDEEPPLPTNYSDDLDPSLLPDAKPSASNIRSTAETQPTSIIAQQPNKMESKTNRQQSSTSNEVADPQKKAAGKSKKSQPESSRLIPEIESFELSPVPLKVKEQDLAKKEEEAAKMKERIRQEEMRKAKEAEERKRRQAERANAKALARAQKDAERKEKEKQKKANKKAAAAAAATNTAGNDTTLSSDKVESGASHDFKSSPVEVKEATSETQKLATSQRKKSVSQRVKPKSVFPAAKKGRKGFQTWMWILLSVCLCFAVMILWFYF